MTATNLALAALTSALAVLFAAFGSRHREPISSLALWAVSALALPLAVFNWAVCFGLGV
jgi:hypothetical protein